MFLLFYVFLWFSVPATIPFYVLFLLNKRTKFAVFQNLANCIFQLHTIRKFLMRLWYLSILTPCFGYCCLPGYTIIVVPALLFPPPHCYVTHSSRSLLIFAGSLRLSHFWIRNWARRIKTISLADVMCVRLMYLCLDTFREYWICPFVWCCLGLFPGSC